MQNVTPEIITASVAALFTILFAAWPPARQWFDTLTADQQAIGRGAVVVVLSLVAAGFGCQLVSAAICASNDLARFAVDTLLSAVLGLKASDGAFTVARYWLDRLSSPTPTTRGILTNIGRPKLL